MSRRPKRALRTLEANCDRSTQRPPPRGARKAGRNRLDPNATAPAPASARLNVERSMRIRKWTKRFTFREGLANMERSAQSRDRCPSLHQSKAGAGWFESVRGFAVFGGGVGRKICRKALKSLVSRKENEASNPSFPAILPQIRGESACFSGKKRSISRKNASERPSLAPRASLPPARRADRRPIGWTDDSRRR